MTRDRSTPPELAVSLRRALAQCRHLTAQGRDAFLDPGLDAQIRRLAGERLVITVQAVLDDLPEGFTEEHADLPFATVRGMRNRLAHGYDDIDATIVWRTLDVRLPHFLDEVISRLEAVPPRP